MDLTDFKLLPLTHKVAALLWAADEAVSTAKMRTYFDASAAAAEEALAALAAAEEARIAALRAAAACEYQQRVGMEI